MIEPLMTLHGLDTIYEKIREWLQERPIQNDHADAQVVFNGWPFVNMAYPLLEQSLKALVRTQDPEYNPYEDKHSLKKVFAHLDDKGMEKERMRKGYLAFQSLHNYISYGTLDEFIDNIDNDYAKWRYYPYEGWENGKPAKTSVEAMLEVSRQTLDVLAAHLATDHGLETVGDRLERKITESLTRQANRNYEKGMVDTIKAWRRENDGVLNGIAKIVWRESTAGTPAPYQFEQPLSDLMEHLMADLHKSRDGDIQQFLRRATHASRIPLVWDGAERFFE